MGFSVDGESKTFQKAINYERVALRTKIGFINKFSIENRILTSYKAKL